MPRRNRLDVLAMLLRRHSGYVARRVRTKRGLLGYRYGTLLETMNACLLALRAVQEVETPQRGEQLPLTPGEEGAAHGHPASTPGPSASRQSEPAEGRRHVLPTAANVKGAGYLAGDP